MSLELAKRKYKIYKSLYLSILIFTIIFFICTLSPEFNIIYIFALSLIPLIILIVIMNNKRKYYKKLIYDLEIRETSIRETINDKHLK